MNLLLPCCKINEIFRFAVFGGDMSLLELTHVHVASLNGGMGVNDLVEMAGVAFLTSHPTYV